MCRSLHVTVIALLCATATALAQEPPPEGGDGSGRRGDKRSGQRGDRGARIQRMLQRLDRDGDGAISAAEMERVPERLRERLKRMDTDGDGTISADEIKTITERIAQRSAARDSAGDGTRRGGAFGQNQPLPKGTQTVKDVPYGEHARQKLDLYFPPFPPNAAPGDDAPRPVVVYIHGGGWRGGDKRGKTGFYAWLLQQGYVVASINYRLSGEAKHPAQINDCLAAVRWLKTEGATKYKLKASHLGLVGSSAGGHLAALVGALHGEERAKGAEVRCVVSYFGAHDLNGTTAEGVRANTQAPAGLIGKSREEAPEAWKDASAFTWISKGDPAVLMVHGDKDTTVPISESQVYLKKLQAAGVAAELITVKNAGHGLNGKDLEPALDKVDEKVKAFLARHLLPSKPAAATTPAPAPSPAPETGK